MRLPDDRKRQQICAAAARLFASRPFHEVRLDDIAAAARVGKGTLYIYFPSKDDLYLALVQDGFEELVAGLTAHAGDPSLRALQKLQRVVGGLVDFAYAHPHVFELIRRADARHERPEWLRQRKRLTDLIEQVIRDGIRRGELADDQPQLTALFLPAMVRSALIFGPRGLDKDLLKRQILSLVSHGLQGERA